MMKIRLKFPYPYIFSFFFNCYVDERQSRRDHQKCYVDERQSRRDHQKCTMLYGNHVIKMLVDNHTHIILYHFEKRRKAAQSFPNFNKHFGGDTISERQCKQRFDRFISLEDKPGRGRQSDFDDQALLSAVKGTESLTTRMLADNFSVDPSIIVRRLKKLGKLLYGFSEIKRLSWLKFILLDYY
uniref:HTH_48 domain-containing protein n=1 Tax=Glossina austeni TaxID=7395 RepID=A0A1A9VJG6_GLOAU